MQIQIFDYAMQMEKDKEKLHYQMLESIIEFVSRTESGNWLENAEWYHTDEY